MRREHDVALLAVEYRQRFHKDVLIDLYCYRKHGHNEGDEPRFTQPLMYSVIDQKPTVREMYVERLVEMGQVTREQAETIKDKARMKLQAALDDPTEKYAEHPYVHGRWRNEEADVRYASGLLSFDNWEIIATDTPA